MRVLWIVLTLVSALLWVGWFYVAALGCDYSNGRICGPFQGNPTNSFMLVWLPLLCIIALFGIVRLTSYLLSRTSSRPPKPPPL